MKIISTPAIVALMTATLGLSTLPAAFAQETIQGPDTAQTQPRHSDERGFRPGGNGHQRTFGGGTILGLERGAEAVEIALVRLGHRLDLTEDQAGLLDNLKSVSLAAAEDLAATFDTIRSAAGETAERPDLPVQLENRIAFDKAHLAALESVQPALTAFFDSLDDQQKAALAPDRSPRADAQRGHESHRHDSKRHEHTPSRR
ncbi:Spy/CpxP family protein refolding chaperone [Devosia faecipullorum]|uniref:Spy/CpxP family protein refolding chaperone n=1 Tax=Devosia faecipullorum TaxID=2755039 RepID=UPI00187B6811|nr:Spy/CpxP family protein refolding chaperone [Devosia faecipullorum]MBE7732382.1 Spy/CpxP family protein refolding chaperone [Devosia faecipullorum]